MTPFMSVGSAATGFRTCDAVGAADGAQVAPVHAK
jgi:hypothetical protein